MVIMRWYQDLDEGQFVHISQEEVKNNGFRIIRTSYCIFCNTVAHSARDSVARQALPLPRAAGRNNSLSELLRGRRALSDAVRT